MSRRREKFRHLATTLALVMLVASGCIFSPTPEPPVRPRQIQNPEDLIQVLADAYRAQDFNKFEGLLAVDYLFVLNEPDPITGETQWDRTTEYRIHQRMFDPENIPPGDPVLPAEDWLQTVSITLTAQGAFAERPDLYTTFDPPGPFDPTLWRAESSIYSTDVFFQMPNDRAFQVRGRADFTVITDLTKNIGDPGKFLIFRWEDLEAPVAASTAVPSV